MLEETENQKKGTLGYKITIVAEALIIVLLLFMLNNQKVETQTITVEKTKEVNSLQDELNALKLEHEKIKEEYGDLTEQMTQKDSLIVANMEEIQKLIAKSADYNRIKKQLAYLRNIQQGYVDQLDSLFTVNQQLKNDLQVAHKDIEDERSKSTNLSKEKEELSKIVEVGSALKAYNVEGMGINLKGKSNKEVETFKASRVDRVKICFTIGQNAIAKAGSRTVYIRLSRPDKVVVAMKGDEYSFDAKGTKLQYTLKKEFNYENKSVNMCLNWDKITDEPAMKGIYNVAVFLDGEEIGSSTFELQ